MSDEPPPPKPKPGSLKDRIAAFNNQSTAATPPSRPAPAAKPANWAWKQKQAEALAAGPPPPAPAPSAPSVPSASEPRPEKAASGMSASDAKESIQKGGSLKERMAALQGKGAFGGGDPPPRPPTSEKPRIWKKPVVASPPLTESSAEPASIGDAISAASPPHTIPVKAGSNDSPGTPVDDVPEGETTEHAVQEDVPPVEEEEQDEEAIERQRRAAIAARMAKLGGARVGMAPPMFGKKPVPARKPSHAEDDPPSAASSALEEPKTTQDHEAPRKSSLLTPAPTLDTLSADSSADQPDAPARKLSSASASSIPPPNTKSPPLQVPRRALPPRKKSSNKVKETTPEAAGTTPALDAQDDIKADEAKQETAPPGDDVVPSSVNTDEEVASGSGPIVSEELGDVPKEVEESHEPQHHASSQVDEPASEPESDHIHAAPSPSHEERDETDVSPPVIDESEQLDPEEEERRRRQKLSDRMAKMGGVGMFSPPIRKASVDDTSAHGSPAEEKSISPAAVRRSIPPPPRQSSQPESVAPKVEEVEEEKAKNESGFESGPEDERKEEDASIGPSPARRSLPPPPAPASAADLGAVVQQEVEEEEEVASPPPPPKRNSLPPPPRALPTSPVVAPEIHHETTVTEEVDAEKEEEVPKLPSQPARRSLPPPPRAAPSPATAPETPHYETRPSGSSLDESNQPTPPPIKRLSRPPVPPSIQRPESPAPPSRSSLDEPEFSPPPMRRSSRPPVPQAIRPASPSQASPIQSAHAKPPVPVTHSHPQRRSSTDSPAVDHKPARRTTLPPPPILSPPVRTSEESLYSEREILDEADTDPIDPSFYSPVRSPSTLDLTTDNISSPVPESAPVEAEPANDEDEESARRRTIAQRMAKLGGMKMGMPGLPPPTRKQPRDGEEESHVLSPEPIEREEEPAEENAEDERTRRAAIAARLASQGGMRFGMFPGAAPKPPPRAPSPPPVEDVESVAETLTSDDGVKVEAEDESEIEVVRHEDLGIEPVNTRSARSLSSGSADIPPPLPQGRRSSMKRPPVPGSISTNPRRTSIQSTGPAPASPTIASHPPPNDFVLVDEPEDASPPPPPRNVARAKSRRSLPPPPAPPAEEPSVASPDLSRSQWELPTIPSTSGLDISDTHSDDDTVYPPAPAPAPAPTNHHQGGSSSSAKQAPPRQPPSADELMVIWGKMGTQVLSHVPTFVEQSKKSVIGDGSSEGFVTTVISSVPNAARVITNGGPATISYGYLVYSQTGGTVQKRASDIMPGDVIAFFDVKLKGHKGLSGYSTHVGMPEEPLVGIIHEFEPKKSKVKVYHATLHANSYPTVESASYRLDDIRSGIVKVYRVAEA